MAKREVTTVLLDADGVLVDSLWAVRTATIGAILMHSSNEYVNPDRLEENIHGLHHIHGAFNIDDPYDEFKKSYDAVREIHADNIRLFNSAPALLATLESQGMKLGVVSTSRYIRETLERNGILDAFSVVVGGLDTPEHKPHPAPVLRALELLDRSPEETVIVGDLPADIEAGKAAGLAATIGVTYGYGTASMIREAKPDCIAHTIDEIPTAIASLSIIMAGVR